MHHYLNRTSLLALGARFASSGLSPFLPHASLPQQTRVSPFTQNTGKEFDVLLDNKGDTGYCMCMKHTAALIALGCLLAASLGGLSLREAFEASGSGTDGGVEYDRLIELQTGQTYEGGLLVGPMFDYVGFRFYGEPGQDVRIKGNGAILDLQGQQSEIAYCNNRLDIDDCIILNGGIRFAGISADTVLVPTGSVRYCTFFRPQDYAIRLQGAGTGVTIERNISVSPIDTGYDFVYMSGIASEWLPTGTSYALSVQVGLYGRPVMTGNWSWCEDPSRNADSLSHTSQLCEYG